MEHRCPGRRSVVFSPGRDKRGNELTFGRKTLLVSLTGLVITAAGLSIVTDRLVQQSEERYPPIGEFVTVDGALLHYVEKGNGVPVVMIHGDGSRWLRHCPQCSGGLARAPTRLRRVSECQAIGFQRNICGASWH
jgi:hypothetical protein